MRRARVRRRSVGRRSGLGRRGLLIGAVLATVVAGIGVGLYLSTSSRTPVPGGGPGAAPSPEANVPLGTLPGQLAPDFTLRTSNGQDFRLSDHRGEVVVLDFLAPG